MKIAATLSILLATAGVAHADTLVTTAPTGGDSVTWSQLGTDGTTIANPFSFTTTNGVSGTGSYASSGTGVVFTEGSSWYGNFTAGEVLNYNSTNGAITLNFGSGFTEIGAYIQSNAYGAYTAEICDANGCFTEDGNANGNNDGSAIFIGISSDDPITWATFSLTAATNNSIDDFAIGDVVLSGGSATPEPSSLALLGTGMVGTAGLMRRRMVRS